MNTFQNLCNAAAAKSAKSDTEFGITIPSYTNTIAQGFKADTLTPTTNATLESAK